MAVSMSGLDLSFMHSSPDVKVPKKKKKQVSSKRSSLPCPVLMTDIKPFVSPIDDTLISSRSQLRAHERKHNVRQAGDFKKGELIEKENKRIAETRRLAKEVNTKWM